MALDRTHATPVARVSQEWWAHLLLGHGLADPFLLYHEGFLQFQVLLVLPPRLLLPSLSLFLLL